MKPPGSAKNPWIAVGYLGISLVGSSCVIQGIREKVSFSDMLQSSAEQTAEFLITGIGEFSLGELTCQLCRRHGKAVPLDHLIKDLLASDLALWLPGTVTVSSCNILSVIVPTQALYHLSTKKVSAVPCTVLSAF